MGVLPSPSNVSLSKMFSPFVLIVIMLTDCPAVSVTSFNVNSFV